MLLSSGVERTDRRKFNEDALETAHSRHSLAERFEQIVETEAATLAGARELRWENFSDAWFRVVRRVVFGDAAREDHALSREMAQLRSDANWAFLRSPNEGLRENLFRRIRGYLREACPGSLAGAAAHAHQSVVTAPEQQIPQWLFAFDPAGMATFRALALLASHRDYARQAIAEIDASDRPALRAAIFESLRLWPTSPLILRESTSDTEWSTGRVPGHTTFVVFTPFFHRDRERFADANRFAPRLWTEDAARALNHFTLRFDLKPRV